MLYTVLYTDQAPKAASSSHSSHPQLLNVKSDEPLHGTGGNREGHVQVRELGAKPGNDTSHVLRIVDLVRLAVPKGRNRVAGWLLRQSVFHSRRVARNTAAVASGASAAILD